MPFFGLLIAVILFFQCKRHLQRYRREHRLEEDDVHFSPTGSVSWHDEWHRQWADKFQRETERRRRYAERHLRHIDRKARRFGFSVVRAADTNGDATSTAAGGVKRLVTSDE